MKYNVTLKGTICDNYLCSELYSYSSYDKIITTPIYMVDRANFIYKINDLKNYNTTNKLIYTYFEIYCETDKYAILTIYSNYQGMKMWINNNYNGYFSDWVKRKIVFLQQGVNKIYCEIVDPDLSKVLFYLKDINQQNNYILDDYIDIKNDYMLFEKLKDNFIRLVIQSDNVFQTKDEKTINITTPIIDFSKRTIKYKKIDSIKVEVNKIYLINCTMYSKDCDYKWIFLELGNQKIRVFLSDASNEKKYLFKKIKSNKLSITTYEYKNIAKINNRYQKRVNLSDEIKYYFLYGELIKTFSRFPAKTKEDFLKSEGYKEIDFISKLDHKKTTIGLYIPKDFDKKNDMNLIIILAASGYNNYIETYFNYFSKKYLIVEFNLRGNNYGNFIGEFIFFETLNKINTLYKDIKINNRYLFGYSSCASAVISLAGKYPSLFTGCLAIAGKCNNSLLKNVNKYVNTILIYGDYDVDIKDTYYENQKNIEGPNKKVRNILLNGFDHTTIACFMRNKLLISKVLKFKKRIENINEYYGISESYSPNKNIKILERNNKEKDYFIKINKVKEKIIIEMVNVKVLEIYSKHKKLFIINGMSQEIYKKQVLQIAEKECTLVNNYDYQKINNGMGIINIYSAPIIFWLNSIQDLENIYGIYKPKNMTKNPYNEIDYPCQIVNKKNLTNSNNYKKQNNVFYNIIFNKHNLYSIKFNENGFEYLGELFTGKYSILQICRNGENYYSLYINDNDPSLSKKNFFLRNVFIPSEVYNIKSIYTNIAIIYIDNKYYYINEYGNEMKEYI